MKPIFLALLSTLFFLSSCQSDPVPDLNGEWELTNSIDLAVDPPVKRFRIENDSVVITIFRGYFEEGEGRIYAANKELFIKTGHELSEYTLVRLATDTLIFIVKEEPNRKYLARRINPTRATKMMSYLDMETALRLPNQKDADHCEPIEPKYRLELIVHSAESPEGTTWYELGGNAVSLNRPGDFHLGYQRLKVKTPASARSRIQPIIYADDNLDETTLDSLSTLFSSIGFTTVYRAKFNSPTGDINDFPVCYVPVN